MSIPIQSPSQLSTHLKSLRKAQGLTQAQLGARIGVGQTRVADIEKHPGAVSVEQLLHVLHALDARLLLAPPAPASLAKGATPPAGDW
jgi:HTH-type transcriptional regulator/antitoxin HipB